MTNNIEASIKNLAENYGTDDLLTAYIMRTLNVSCEVASDMVYRVDYALEMMLDEIIESENEEEEE